MKGTRRRTPPADPTSERTADQSTQENSGLHEGIQGVRPGPGPELAREEDSDDVLNRSVEQRYETPRRYEGAVDDAALPADDSTLNTKI
ncbi:MAG TPA: hypothetical protein VJ813_10320 [Vicinamibacterales bacterium]|nr:hypothetical protein [Vicinamibacterales bacterium]